MANQKKLLVLVDGSERSIQTVNYVKDFMPVDENTKIVLFHVFRGLPEEYRKISGDRGFADTAQQLKDWETAQQEKIHVVLKRAKEILITGGFPEQSVEVKFHFRENGVALDIIDEAKNGYSAVVLRRRGMGALKSSILGSVAVKLLASLTFIPIIIVGQALPVKKILLAVDGSPSSMKAVDFVGVLLGGKGYAACIFHAILGLGGVNFELSGFNEQKAADEMADNCVAAFKSGVLRLFQDVREKLTAAGFEPEKISEKIITGAYSRSDAIVREAEDGGYGTIVVGRRGLSKVDAFFMGRVGHKVVYGGKKFSVWVV